MEQNGASINVGTPVRQLGPIVGIVLVLTAVGFFATRAHGESDARHDSIHRAEIAATQVQDRIAQASTLLDGVRRFLSTPDTAGATSEQFAAIGARWLGPVGLPAAAWIERVPGRERAGYERRTGRLIVVLTPSGGIRSADLRTTYFPATLVTGSPPLTSPGIDLGGIPGIAAAIARPETAYRVRATPLAHLADGTSGLFLVRSAQRLNQAGVVEPGFVVLFISASWVLAGATDQGRSSPGVEVAGGGASAGDLGNAAAVESTFTAAGQPFAVRVARSGVSGAAAAQPWLVGGAGLMLAVLAGALRVIAARRTRAKADLDRLFTLSRDLIVVAGFDGFFKRVNPAFEQQLGYTQQEALSRPYIEFVHPDDRERTDDRRRILCEGSPTIAFENRYICKDGSVRWIEWNATPVVEQRLIYGVARDVTERRMAEANLREAEERTRGLADEQAALRRVATLVARGAPSKELFAAVAEEVGQLLPVTSAAMGQYEPDGLFTTVAAWSAGAVAFPVGDRWFPEGRNVTTLVLETARPARLDTFADASGPVGVRAREAGYRSAVGTPIIVDGRLWGVMTAASTSAEPLPADTELRLASFTELVATAIANTESRAESGRLLQELTASRARVVAAADETRRRIERDLHDGVQQRLVSLALQARAMTRTTPEPSSEIRDELTAFAEQVTDALDELREYSRGIHPAILSEAGLGAALRTLARRSVVPVVLDMNLDSRLEEPIEAAAYYIASEALTNAVKHAQATVIELHVDYCNSALTLAIRDDGIGGAEHARGSGLIGLKDRVEALGGSISVTSPPGQGTLLRVKLPVDSRAAPTAPRSQRSAAAQ